MNMPDLIDMKFNLTHQYLNSHSRTCGSVFSDGREKAETDKTRRSLFDNGPGKAETD